MACNALKSVDPFGKSNVQANFGSWPSNASALNKAGNDNRPTGVVTFCIFAIELFSQNWWFRKVIGGTVAGRRRAGVCVFRQFPPTNRTLGQRLEHFREPIFR